MKKIISHYVSLTALILCLLSACNDFMDTHQKYTEGGEIVYAPKVDSLNFFAGKGQIYGQLILKNAPNVRNIKVSWNVGADSLLIPVSPTTGVDTIRFMLPNMPEKAYTFDVRTTDSYGHFSLVTSGFGYSYGENYQNSLRNQNVK
ncbi:MAG: DUF4998 domain-containing protein, partial [Candidatus Symbiothrix sp.]|nr:DUF4998 domain-containing protein [Candidatus Symbiothrix sp.]